MTTENLPYIIIYDVCVTPNFSFPKEEGDETPDTDKVFKILAETNILLWDSSLMRGNSTSQPPQVHYNPNYTGERIQIKDVSKEQ
jgi:hypothetical protein